MPAPNPNDTPVPTPGPARTETPPAVAHEPVRETSVRQYRTPERKAGFPWWLLLLPIIPLLFLALRRDDDRDERPRTAAATPAPIMIASPTPAAVGSASSAVLAEPTPGEIPGRNITVHQGPNIAVTTLGGASAKGEPLSDVVMFAPGMDAAELSGRKVKITDANVSRVFNERAFLVNPGGNAAPLLVVLDQDMYATGGKTVVVKQNRPVSVVGIMTPAPDAEAMQAQGVPAAAMSAARPGDYYLLATVAQTKDAAR